MPVRKLGILAAFTLLLSIIFWVAGRSYHALTIDAGTERDAAFLVDFRGPETLTPEAGSTTFQWSRPSAQVRLPAASQSDVWQVKLRLLHRAEDGPASARLRLADETLDLQIQPGWRIYHVLAPASGGLTIESDTSAIANPTLRDLGLALDLVEAVRIGQGWSLPWLYLLTAILLAGFAAAVIDLLELAPRDGWLVLGGVALLVALALWLHFARAVVILPTLSWLLLGLGGIGYGLRWLLKRPLGTLSGIVAGTMVVTLLLKLVGMLYPGFLPTDLLFHVNRIKFALDGNFYFTSEGQGQEFPYPVGSYALIIPWLAATPAIRWVAQILGLLFDTSTIILIALLLRQAQLSRRSIKWACVLYAVMPAGFLLYNQNALAQNVGQWLGFWYLTLLILSINAPALWLDPANRRSRWLALVTLGFLATQGHFGVFLNLLLLFSLLLVFNLRFVRTHWRWIATWLVAVIASIVLYYADFLALFREQTRSLTAVPADPLGMRWFMLRRFVVELGLYDHYLIIYVVAAVLGLLLLRRSELEAQQVLGRWMGAMLATSGVLMLAVVVILFNPTRYIIFAYPAIVIGAAVYLDRVDDWRWGRVATRLLLAVTIALALAQWATDFALHQRTAYLS
ncbi:MAG: hypothetical protein H0T53_02745 [Herpetosiphonaceae bacterium]|nr:hypothetical protein [Herpetosiphonaceae bacterium]